MKNKFLKGIFLTLGSLALLTLKTDATPIDPHAYAIVNTSSSTPLHGTYFVSQNTDDIFNANPTSSAIITKETWLDFNNSNPYEWIETGSIYGNIYATFYNHSSYYPGYRGSFAAFNGCTGSSSSVCSSYTTTFQEGAISSGLSGKHNFIIRKKTDGSGNYSVYQDYNLITTISGSSFLETDPVIAQIGIESSDTTNTWTSGTIAYDWWIVDPNNETNSGTAGWYPVNNTVGTTQISNSYNNASIIFQYPYNNGTTVPAGAVTASNRFLFNHN